MRRTLCALALAALGACYRYEPLTTPTPVVGTELRSFLTQEGAASMATTFGRNVVVFDGRLMADQENVWRFAVTQTRTSDARSVNWSGEPVSVPRTAIARMEQRVLDRPKTIRTAIFATLGAVAVGVMVKAISTESSGSPGGNGTIPP
jgi:hypothetical protein